MIELKNDFRLIEADPKKFGIHIPIYNHRATNVWFPTKMERVYNMFANIKPQYWILKDGQRIGGVVLSANWFGFLFVIPPFNDKDILLRSVLDHVISISDDAKPIYVSGVYPNDYERYQRLGFQIKSTEKIMIRPTGSFELDWPEDDITMEAPDSSHKEELIDIYYHVYSQSPVSSVAEKGRDYYKAVLENDHLPALKPEYSTLIYDESGQLSAACIVTIWEELPYIADLMVKDSLKGKGLGRMMVKKAINNAHQDYPAIRLAVAPGNRAENLYHQLGFVGGIPSSTMYLEF